MSEKTTDRLGIEARNLTKTYRGHVRALDGLSFSVNAGTIFGLLGPNGAGKSTTVKILTTLSRPSGGGARVAGIDVTSHPNEVRRAIGYVAQKSGVDPDGTGRENLTLQGQVYGLRGAALKSRVTELLERFDLIEAADRVCRTYSGGMQRKLDIAMGLVHRPQILFLDEPTTGLDPESRAALWDTISTLSKDDGLTVLLTTHYLEEADRLAERLAIVDDGKVVVEGSPEELKGELHGDTINIELREQEKSAESVRDAIRQLEGVDIVLHEGTSLHTRARNGAASVPNVITALESEGVHVTSVTVSRPSLDDVYLQYTGRSFHIAQKGDPA